MTVPASPTRRNWFAERLDAFSRPVRVALWVNREQGRGSVGCAPGVRDRVHVRAESQDWVIRKVDPVAHPRGVKDGTVAGLGPRDDHKGPGRNQGRSVWRSGSRIVRILATGDDLYVEVEADRASLQAQSQVVEQIVSAAAPRFGS